MSRLRTVIAGLTTVHFAVGVWLATSIPGPLLSADDLAYMSMARTLAGRGASPLGHQPPYGFLYPMLIAPGWSLGLGESSILTWARVVNALLASLLIPVLYLIGRRVLAADPKLSLFAAVLGSSLPAVWLTASVAWTESLLALLVGVAVLALARVCRDTSWISIAGVAITATALEAAHPRMAPIAAGLVISAALMMIGRVRWTAILSLVGAAVILAVGVVHVNDRIQSATFGGTATYAAGDLASTRGLSEVPDMAVHAMGTLAYLVVVGVGITLVGAWAMWRAGIVGRAFGIAVVISTAVAGWFLTGVPRSDAYLHGRYIEILAPILFSAGIVGLTRLKWSTSALVITIGTVVAGVVAAWAGPGDNWAHPRSPVMMLGVEISGAPFGSSVFEPGAAAAVALVVGLLLMAGMQRRRLVVTGAAFFAAVALGIWSGTVGLRALYQSSMAASVDAAIDNVEITRLWIDDSAVASSASGALAWRVGFDFVTDLPDDRVSHLLRRSGGQAPAGAVEVSDFGDVTLWQLE